MARAALQEIVIVGTSLAGLRAAESLRAGGYQGRVHMVGEESVRPYNRPPLSKGLLLGAVSAADIELHGADDINANWHLGDGAVGLDLQSHEIQLSSGSTLHYDALVIATGVHPRWPPDMERGDRLLSLRKLDDAVTLGSLLTDCRRLIVLGAGFVGCEVAATARSRGVEVALVDMSAAPLARAVGNDVAQVLAEIHAENGVSTRFGVGVAEVLCGKQLRGVRLTDGSEIDADLMVVGIGADPSVGWLKRSGIRIDNGVVCDETLRALTTDGGVAEQVWAVGDVARWPHRHFSGELIRVEHWTNAVMSGIAVASNILNTDDPQPYVALPEFWSDQHGINIRGIGRPSADSDIRIESGSLASRCFVASYNQGGNIVGVVGFNSTRDLAKWRGRIGTSAPAIVAAP
jgi:3-phenylpropionate/trans-cinnamate dioxygenase ferredoxin reductase component